MGRRGRSTSGCSNTLIGWTSFALSMAGIHACANTWSTNPRHRSCWATWSKRLAPPFRTIANAAVRTWSSPSDAQEGGTDRWPWRRRWPPVSRAWTASTSSSPRATSSGPHQPNLEHQTYQTAGRPAGADAGVAGPGDRRQASIDAILLSPPAPWYRPPGTPVFEPAACSSSGRYSPLAGGSGTPHAHRMHHRAGELVARGAARDDPGRHGRRAPELLARRPRNAPPGRRRRAGSGRGSGPADRAAGRPAGPEDSHGSA